VSVALWVGRKHWQAGSAAFLRALFSTVFVRLERERWGERYPVLMRELYAGRLAHERAEAASKELQRVREQLAGLAPELVVWDFEDMAACPPWGAEISPDIKSLADYFVTSDGRNFLDVLAEGLHEAQRLREDLEIR
jgi:2,3-bisphosphoglycerate-dependent phosphoglycerate mutase